MLLPGDDIETRIGTMNLRQIIPTDMTASALAHLSLLALVAYSPIAKGRIKNDKALLRIGDRYRKTAAQVCLRWLVQQNVAAIPRTSKLERLSENFEIFDFELSDEDMRLISEMGSARGRLTDYGFAPKWD